MTVDTASPRHVFLVGCARSGSTLLRQALNRSPDVAVAPETHFVRRARRLRLAARLEAATTPAAIETLVNDLYAVDEQSRTGYWAWLRRNIPQVEVARRLGESDRTPAALFELLIALHVEYVQSGDRFPAVVGEKTPSHLLSVPALASWFPGAVFVHTFRDPRAIYASELRRRREGRWGVKRRLSWMPSRLIDPLLAPLELLRTTVAWRRADRLDLRYRKLLGERYRLVRFEDLVRDPEQELRAVCELLGVPFDPSLLDIDVVSSSYHPDRHTGSGFDPGAVDRWRDHVAGPARTWFRIALGARMRARGYQP